MRVGFVSRRTDTPLALATGAAGILLLVLIAGCVSPDRAPSLPQTDTPPSTESPATSTASESDTKAPATAPTPPVTADRTPTTTSPAVPGPVKPVAPPLDLATLEKRLRETEAIGVFTKLTLKNQVDDLVSQFRELHRRRGKPTQLRQPYDLLFLKVLTLLQDDDPPLAKMIVASREAIWGVLADPVKFSTL